jgi:hypothetical protein
MRIFRRAYVVTHVVAAESLPEQAGCTGQQLTQSLRKADPRYAHSGNFKHVWGALVTAEGILPNRPCLHCLSRDFAARPALFSSARVVTEMETLCPFHTLR